MSLSPFPEPIYVTRPLLPPLTELYPYLQEIWNSKTVTNCGNKHQELEHLLAQRLKVPHLSLFNNGMIALEAACRILNLSGEVITTPFTFPATTHALSLNKLTPVFCDINQDTMNLDPPKLEALITPKTSAILAVHVYGTPCDVNRIEKIAKQHSLKVIYDAAHAFGVEVNGRGIGTYGDITMYSFHATKLFHTLEGGALAYESACLNPLVKISRNFGIKSESEVLVPGTNGKMNEIQAAIGLLNLKHASEEQQKRKQLIQAYRHHLNDVPGLILPPTVTWDKESCQYFVIRIQDKSFGVSRDDLYTKLKEYNIFARKYFHPLCSEFPCYKELPSAKPNQLPVAHQVSLEVLSLPLYGQLSLQDIEKICLIIKTIGKQARKHA